MKEQSEYRVEFDSSVLRALFNSYRDRYVTVDIKNGMCDIVHNRLIHPEYVFDDGEFSEADVECAMEEILECNLLSFINDW